MYRVMHCLKARYFERGKTRSKNLMSDKSQSNCMNETCAGCCIEATRSTARLNVAAHDFPALFFLNHSAPFIRAGGSDLGNW